MIIFISIFFIQNIMTDLCRLNLKVKYLEEEDGTVPMEKVIFLIKTPIVTAKFMTIKPYDIEYREWLNFLEKVKSESEEAIIDFDGENAIRVKNGLVTFRTSIYNVSDDCSHTQFTLSSSLCIEAFEELLALY